MYDSVLSEMTPAEPARFLINLDPLIFILHDSQLMTPPQSAAMFW